MVKRYETVIVDQFPSRDEMEEGVIYFSKKLMRSTHLCPCNCGEEVYLSHYRGGWKCYVEDNGDITISTLIRNIDCKTFYKIKSGYAFID